ncbi:MAG: hypothetical protein PHQ74_02640 [Crocinitomicaceae bacterium]|nr:hypothetical protein [Crocinitomicaceae bacterium]
MKFPKYVTDEQIKQLQFEVLSQDFYIYLTRYLFEWCEETGDALTSVIKKNRLINLSRTISGGKIYTLTDDLESVEFSWHDSNFLLIFRQLDTIQFIEFICDLINYEYFKVDFINQLLKKEGASFYLYSSSKGLEIEIYSIEKIEKENLDGEHVNIRTLVARMDSAFENDDFANVLHASASIFEVMAKDIIGITSIQEQTLKSFFERYRNDSKLPAEILDYILKTYDSRNSTALAGHGSLSIPDITKEQAIILNEMTKAFVRIEYRIQREV